jgi:hypothetical protein
VPKSYEEVFKELDAAARANLGDRGVREYEAYKVRLIADGDAPDEVELILRGFIWDQAECEARDESEGR